ncbi:MAG: hypothetical protein WBM83_12005 [Flavobacteriaceae bacterium]
MKTYKIFYAVLALFIIGCSKSDDNGGTPEEIGAKADYTLLVSANGLLKAEPLNATSETFTINPGKSPFTDMVMPQATFKNGSVLSTYQRTTECGGELTIYDFSDHSSSKVEVFGDLEACSLTVNGIAHHDTSFFIAYSLITDTRTDYFVRVLESSGSSFVDVSINKKPIQMVVAKNRLFVLTKDEEVTLENGLIVMDLKSNGLIFENNLGLDVRKMLVNNEGNLIISYEELHTVLDASTFGQKYVNYQSGLEPKFSNANTTNFDGSGKLYYERPPTGESAHANIPAIYDFGTNTAFLYIYENFLTQAQIEFELEIGDTTMVCYDENSGLMLIGYKKAGSTTKGGVLRVKPVPDPEFVDNINVDGIPYDIFVK